MTAQPSPSRVQIPPQFEAEMTPAVKAFVEAAFAKCEQRIAELEKQVWQWKVLSAVLGFVKSE